MRQGGMRILGLVELIATMQWAIRKILPKRLQNHLKGFILLERQLVLIQVLFWEHTSAEKIAQKKYPNFSDVSTHMCDVACIAEKCLALINDSLACIVCNCIYFHQSEFEISSNQCNIKATKYCIQERFCEYQFHRSTGNTLSTSLHY